MFSLRAMRFMTVRILAWASVWFTSSAVALGHVPGTRDIADSGYFGRTAVGQDVYWLDNSRVIFIGYAAAPKHTAEQEARTAGIIVWDTATRRTARYADVASTSWLCSHASFVNYGFVRSGVRRLYVGELTKERVIDQLVGGTEEQLVYSPISCREYDPSQIKKRYGSNLLPLLLAGEYLDRGTPGGAAEMRYFPGEGRSAISLSDLPTPSVLTLPRYSAFLDKYVFQELRTTTATHVPYHVWLLDRSGTVTRAQIPPGPWLGGSVEAMPVRHGLVIKTRAAGADGSIGAAGIYVVDGGRPRRVLAGMPYRLAVAPDGCKVAVSVNTDWTKPSSLPRIMLVSLCTAEK
jgi:hypothetical protein